MSAERLTRRKLTTRLLLAGSLTCACSLLGLQSAHAATSTGNMTVSMTIQAECKLLSTTNIAFGTRGVVDSVSDGTATLGVQCTNTTPYTIGLGAGAGAGATTAARKMTAGGATLNYSLYRDAGRTLNWGDTINTDTLAGTGSGALQSHTVYGRVPVQTTPAAGAYSDTVQITVTY